MTATVFYDSANEVALITNTFTSAGNPADPTTVSCIVTDPSNTSVTHTYLGAAPSDISKVSTGKYTLAVPCSAAVAGALGLWGFEWVGTGAVSDVQPGTWRVLPANISQLWYVGLEEMKGRLGIALTDTSQDYELQTSIAASAGWVNEYCVVMDTPVLTADLQWKQAGDLMLGQELIGVDEEPVLRPDANGAARWLRSSNHGRRYRRAEVLANPCRRAKCIRLVMADGREVTCATDHRWLARQLWPNGRPKRGYRWTYARDISSGDEIAAPLRTWPEETSFEAGWVSGLFDGEGWIARETATHSRIGVSQNSGIVLNDLVKHLDNAGIVYNRAGTPCVSLTIERRWAAMEVLGRYRPRRLLQGAAAIWEGQTIVGTGPNNVKVIAVEPAGLREVVSLGTSTGTYIANGLISHNCGRHFNRITETRTYQPDNIWQLNVDDIVPGSAITVNVDQDGDGVYEQAWTQGTDYILKLGPRNYNVNASGIPRPYRQLQVVQSGKWLPFTWPYTHLDRVQIATTWGWTFVPWQVTEANRILSADEFRMKDAPFGVAGVSDIGLVRIQSNPWLVENLRAFVSPRRKVGV